MHLSTLPAVSVPTGLGHSVLDVRSSVGEASLVVRIPVGGLQGGGDYVGLQLASFGSSALFWSEFQVLARTRGCKTMEGQSEVAQRITHGF